MEKVTMHDLTRANLVPARTIEAEVPVYERTALNTGEWIEGPALIVEDGTSTHVIAGFEARVSRLGALVLTDTSALQHEHAEAAEVEAA